MSQLTKEILLALHPVGILVCGGRPRAKSETHIVAIRRAFSGGPDVGPPAYTASGEDLGIEIREIFADGTGFNETVAKIIMARALSAARSLVVVAFLHEDDVKEPNGTVAYWDWLNAQASGWKAQGHVVKLLPVIVGNAEEIPKHVAAGHIQRRDLRDFKEALLRPALLALWVLAEAWKVVPRSGARDTCSQLRLFLSHAKMDGLPLAYGLKNFIGEMPFLKRFYDAEEIEPGTDWRESLREGIEHSTVIVLRTNAYDERFWCIKEATWADEFSSPLIVVDARSALTHGRTSQSFAGAPVVRIPDGNHMRVLNAAVRESLRFRLLLSQTERLRELQSGLIPPNTLIFGRAPSLLSYRIEFEKLSASNPPKKPQCVLYPEPSLNSVQRSAMELVLGIPVRTMAEHLALT